MVIGLVGVAVLARPDPANLVGSRFEALVFGAALCFALGSVLTRRLESDLPIETLEAWSMVGGAILMHAISVGLGEHVSGIPPLEAAVALLYLGVVASAVGYLIYFDLLGRLGAIEINLVSYVSPVFAALAGFLFLAEVIDGPTVAGFVIISVGFALVKRQAIRTALDDYRG
jgi:drug/metabolite transporter (DMT)-like permease